MYTLMGECVTMRYVRKPLLFAGVVIAYCLIAALLDWKGIRSDTSKVILLSILVFIWLMTIHPNRKYFS